MAVEEINVAGGIKGQKLVIVSKDDGGKPGDALTDALVWSKGNDYTFRLRLSNYVQASIWRRKAPSCRPKIAPNYEYSQSAVAVFLEKGITQFAGTVAELDSRPDLRETYLAL